MKEKEIYDRDYLSPNNFYKLKYSSNWICTNDLDGKGNTLMLYKEKDGRGTLRIDALKVRDKDKEGKRFDAGKLLKEYKLKYKGSKLQKRRDLIRLMFIDENPREKDIILYWWFLTKKNVLLMISYTTGKIKRNSIKTKFEIKEIQKIIDKIEILPNERKEAKGVENMVMQSDLNKLKEKFNNFKIADLPDNDIEEEIFAELDLLYFDLYGQLTNKKKYPPFDLKYAKECMGRIQKGIKQRGERDFKKNKILFEWCLLCLKAIKLMEEYNKK